MDYKEIIESMKKKGVKIADGLDRDALSKIGEIYGFTFPSSLAEFYSYGVPTGEAFLNWGDLSKENIAKIKHILDTAPYNGLLFSVNNGFWLDSWGKRPENKDELEARVGELIKNAPKLIPVFGHRYLPIIDGVDDPPVLSIVGSDAIYYGLNLADYFAHEFGFAARQVGMPNAVPFWSEIIEANSLPPYAVIAAHKFCSNNREMLENDRICGCFYCRMTYATSHITDWIDGGNTARCPFCGIDSVIPESAGYPLSSEFLRIMNEYWFTAPSDGTNIELTLKNPHFLGAPEEQAHDLCLHGGILFKIGGEVVCDTDDELCVSASALMFLRSLYSGHEKGSGKHMVPCCGHFMVPADDMQSVEIIGCPNGEDFDIYHRSGKVFINGFQVSYKDYRYAVLKLAKTVKAIYDASPERVFEDEYKKHCYTAFWNEWNSLFVLTYKNEL